MPYIDWNTDRQPFAVGDRVITCERPTLGDDQLEELSELFGNRTGEVVEAKVMNIDVYDNEGQVEKVLSLSVAFVRLDCLPDHPMPFHVDELYAELPDIPAERDS